MRYYSRRRTRYTRRRAPVRRRAAPKRRRTAAKPRVMSKFVQSNRSGISTLKAQQLQTESRNTQLLGSIISGLVNSTVAPPILKDAISVKEISE